MTMALRQDVLDAFNALGLTPDVDIEEATKVYRRLALQHHPDRNHGDPNATQRFQQISHSWDICQRYYEGPECGPEGRYYDDMDLDEEDLVEFYMFMFTETLFNRFNSSSRKQYKNERFSRRGGPVIFSFGPMSPEIYRSWHSDDCEDRQGKNAVRQQKEKEEYERRKRELELEIEREEREAKERALRQKADEDRLVGAQEHAFQAAHSGNAEEVVRLIDEYNLDVTAPRHMKMLRGLKKDKNPQYETLLHAAACQCDENLFTFLIEKGANPGILNKQSLNPFHVAIKAGNSKLVRFILERRSIKSFQDYHPSKATLLGITPLQLAIESSDSATIELLVKHATTHDVERCWDLSISEDIKEILRTKKGFVPPGEGLESGQSRGMSKKAQRQQELAQEKEARIAEELKRAEINRQKKEERAAKRAAREEEQLRCKTAAKEEEAERQRQEEIRRAEAEVRARELEEEIRRTEAEEVRLRAEEEIRREEAEARARKLKEEEFRAESEAKAQKLKEVQEAKERAEAEAKSQKLKEVQGAKEKAEAEARERAAVANLFRVEKERQEMQRIEQDRIQKAREERERQRLEQETREKERIERQKAEIKSQEEMRHRSLRGVIAPPGAANVADRTMPHRNRHVNNEQRRELRQEKQKERKKAKREEQKAATSTDTRPGISSPFPQPKVSAKKAKPEVDVEQMDERQRNRHEQIIKRRAEQSARDKERHRRMLEERKKVESPSQSEQSEYLPLTPVSARPESVRSLMFEPTLLSLNGTPYMEDIQTCIVPDDLFREVRPLYEPSINSEGASFVADPVAESQPARKPYRRFFRHHRSKRGPSQSGEQS